MVTEKEARRVIGEEKCDVLDANKFQWTENLSYSHVEGWTNGICSFIYEDEIMARSTTVKDWTARIEFAEDYHNLRL